MKTITRYRRQYSELMIVWTFAIIIATPQGCLQKYIGPPANVYKSGFVVEPTCINQAERHPRKL